MATSRVEFELETTFRDDISFAEGQELEPAQRNGNIFSRLHAEHAARIERQAQIQQAAEADEMQKKLNRQITRAQADWRCRRLHDEAEQRRRRLDRQRRLEEESEIAKQAMMMVGANARADQTVGQPRWKKLYRTASLQERRLEMKRRKQLEEEERWLEEVSVHRSTGISSTDQAFKRLYKDGRQRGLRLEKKRVEQVEEEEKWLETVNIHGVAASRTAEQACARLYEDGCQRDWRLEKLQQEKSVDEVRRLVETSVHPPIVVPPAAIEDHLNALYEDARIRRAYLEEQRQVQRQQEVERRGHRSASSGAAMQRVEMLYDDATRREEARLLRRAQLEMEELEKLRAESVHAGASQRERTEAESRADLSRLWQAQVSPRAERSHHSSSPRGRGHAVGLHGRGVPRHRSTTPPPGTRWAPAPDVVAGPPSTAAKRGLHRSAPAVERGGGKFGATGAPLLISELVQQGMRRAMALQAFDGPP